MYEIYTLITLIASYNLFLVKSALKFLEHAEMACPFNSIVVKLSNADNSRAFRQISGVSRRSKKGLSTEVLGLCHMGIHYVKILPTSKPNAIR